MIYLSNTTDAQVAFIPRDTDIAGTLFFTMRSTVDLDTPLTATVVDLRVWRTVYAVAVILPEGIQTGEYEYKLEAGGNVVSTGVLIVGDYKTDITEYDKQIRYEQYNG